MKTSQSILLSPSVLILALCVSNGMTFEKGTHRYLNQQIARMTTNGFRLDSYLKDNLGFQHGAEELVSGDSEVLKKETKQEVFMWMGEGGIKEDEPESWWRYLTSLARNNNHFHNPLARDWGSAGFDLSVPVPGLPFSAPIKGYSSILWAHNKNQNPGGNWSWYDAREYYYTALTGRKFDGQIVAETSQERDKYFANTFRAVGQLMHLVQDASVPAHTRNEPHLLPFNYELWLETLRNREEDRFKAFFAQPYGVDLNMLNGPPDPLPSIGGFELTPIAKLIDTDRYDYQPFVTATEPVGLSEFTNANFFGEFTTHNVKFKDPDLTSIKVEQKDDEIPDPRDPSRKVLRKYYFRRIGDAREGSQYRLATVGFLKDYVTQYFPSSMGSLKPALDGRVYNDYASLLAPRAIGYSAGLLNYFFRGQLNAQGTDKKPNGDIEVAIVNLSEDTLVAGDFELYYDHKDGTRRKVDNLTPSHVEGLSKYDKEKPGTIFKATFSPPGPTDFDSTKKDWYMLVYRGQLGGTKDAGGEKEAIIGRYQQIQPVIPVMVTYDQNQNRIFFKVNSPNENRYFDLAGIIDSTEDIFYGVKFVQPVTYNANYGVIAYYRTDTEYDTVYVLKYHVTKNRTNGVEVIYNGERYKQADFAYDLDEITYDDSIDAPAYNLVNSFVGTNPSQSVTVVTSTLERSELGSVLNIVPYLRGDKLEYSLATSILFTYKNIFNWTNDIYSGTKILYDIASYGIIYNSASGWSKTYNMFGYTGNFFVSRTNERPGWTIDTVLMIYPEFKDHSIVWGPYWPLQWYWPDTLEGALGLFTADASELAGFGILSGLTTMSQDAWMRIGSWFLYRGTGYLTYFDTSKEASKGILSGPLWQYYHMNYEPHGLGTVDRASGMVHLYAPPIYGLPDSSFKSLYVINGTVYKWSDPIPEELVPPEIYPYGRSLSDFSKELNVASLYYKLDKVPVCIYKGQGGSYERDPDTGGGRFFGRLALTGKFEGKPDLTGISEFKTGTSTLADFMIVEKASTFALMVEKNPPFHVLSVSPSGGLTGVPINVHVAVQFDRPVDVTTVNGSIVLMETSSGSSVPGSVCFDFDNKVLFLVPYSNLNPNTNYTLNVTSVKGEDGAPLSSVFESTFTTGEAADIASPLVTVIPPDGAGQVPINSSIAFNFSKPINQSTVNSSTVTVMNNGAQAFGITSLTPGKTGAVFSPSSNFTPNSTVSVILSHKVTDLAGNRIVGSAGPGTDFVSSFTAAATIDSTGPQVVSMNPANGAIAVDPNAAVSVTFNEAINPLTVTGKTFIVSTGGTQYSGQISFSGQNTIVTFTPDQPFAAQSMVDITLKTEIRDMAGNAMPNVITSAFAVQAGPALTIGYSAPITPGVGDSVSLIIGDAGDVGTSTEIVIRLADMSGKVIYQNFVTDSIQSGGHKTYTFQIPKEIASGNYTLYVEASDQRGKKITSSYDIRINGLNASLRTSTEKDVYLPTDTIKGITTAANGSFRMENGRLGVSVSKLTGAVSGKFEAFLPKGGWSNQWNLAGIAVDTDGLMYVLDYSNHRVQKIDGEAKTVILEWGAEGSENGQFNSPEGIAIGPDGSIYVTDSENNRIQKFRSDGTFVGKWGTQGAGDGQFSYPEGIAVGSDGSIYVVDSDNHRIQKFTSDGTFIGKWGTQGAGDGQFSYPQGIAIGPGGFVYVADRGNNRIQKFTSSGIFIGKWGSEGSSDGQFNSPSAIAVGPEGSAYVVDTFNYRIQKFDGAGNFVMKWGNRGGGFGQFLYPSGIATGPGGNVYVTDDNGNGIQKFAPNGDFVAGWGNEGAGDGRFSSPVDVAADTGGSIYVVDAWKSAIQKFDSGGNFIMKWGSQGTGDGQFDHPIGIAISRDDFVYIVDGYNNRIQKFDSSGNFITKWGTKGNGDGQFDGPIGIGVGPDGSVYVVDSNNQRIQKFDGSGNFILKWGSAGRGPGEFQWPYGVAVGSEGSVYVTDPRNGNDRVQKFDGSGHYVQQWGGYGQDDGKFSEPSGITVGLDGTVYVVDASNWRIQRFDGSGNFIGKWGSHGSGEGGFSNPRGVAVGPDGTIYVVDTGNSRIQRMSGIGEKLFESTISIDQAANASRDYTTSIGTLNTTGKLFLQATLLNSLGQSLANATYPFHVGTVLRVVRANPGSGIANALINTLITVQFSGPVDRATISAASFSLVQTGSGTPISGHFSFDFNDTVVIFTPTGNLNPNTGYTINLTTAIKSTDGMALDGTFSSSFTTGGSADTVSPTVAITPPNGATQVPINTLIVFNFSKSINPVTINSSTVSITDNGYPVSGSITLNPTNTIVTFTPSSNFLPNSSVSVTLSRKVTDWAGNLIVGSEGAGTDFISSFTAASTTDTTLPQILSISPPNGATGVSLGTSISATFSEPINPLTVNSQTFTVAVSGTEHSGQISFSSQDTVVTFTPAHPFPTQSVVNVTLSAGISDLAGNGMPVPFTSSFTTYNGGPILAITYSEGTTRTAGETMHIEVANTGDGDTTSAFTVKLTDSTGLVVYQNTINDAILAGGTRTYAVQIPGQAADGDYLLDAEVIDNKGAETTASFSLRMIGLSATLNSRMDKETYFLAEPITAINTVMNGPFRIENGTLKASVSGIATTTIGFRHFLPKEIGTVFSYPWGIAVGPDGLVYVVDSGSDCILKFDGNGTLLTKWGSNGWDNGQFSYPNNIAVGSDGSVYVADTGNHRIQKFDGNGTFVRTWGIQGSGNGQFYEPSGIALSSDGTVYVADTGNNRVQKFDGNGNFILKWGAVGSSDSQFRSPYGVGVGPDGSVYVADTTNTRVQKFNANGQFVTKWGSYGNGNGQFYFPCNIAVGTDGSVYVVDGSSDRIQKFSSSGTFMAKWGSTGTGDGQLSGPSGIAITGGNSVYVTDSGNCRVEKFDNNGAFIAKWGSGGETGGAFAEPSGIAIGPDGSIYVTDTNQVRVQKFDAAGHFLLKWGTWGYGSGEFDKPSSVAVGPEGSVYVADRGNNLVQKFDSSGNFVLSWNVYSSQFETLSPQGIAIGPDGLIYVVAAPAYPWEDCEVQRFDNDGFSLGNWVAPPSSEGIAIGSDGFIYLVSSDSNLIQKFDTDGNHISQWGIQGSGDGEFNSPQGISIGSDGYIYVSDAGNHRIQKFDGDGNFIAKWGSYGWQEGQFDQPHGIAVGADGSIYVADAINHRIQKLSGGNTPETLFGATLSISQSASTNQDYPMDIGALGITGKFYLQATLTDSLGQSLAQSGYRFYLFSGDIALFFDSDKRVYAPGDPVTISGRVENRGAREMTNLVLTLNLNHPSQSPQLLCTETFNVPAGSSHAFTVATSAGAAGTLLLTGVVTEGDSVVTRVKDWYEVANP